LFGVTTDKAINTVLCYCKPATIKVLQTEAGKQIITPTKQKNKQTPKLNLFLMLKYYVV